MHKPPYRIPQVELEDSGSTIHLLGDFAGWLPVEGTPAAIQGEYHLHGESIRRGVERRTWAERDGVTWHMLNWNLWCYRESERDALRIYLQLVVGDTADLYAEAFPAAITFQRHEEYSTPDEVQVEFRGPGGTQFVAFEPGAYVWWKPYCTIRRCNEEQPGRDGDLEPVLMKPRDRFDEEADFLAQWIRRTLEMELTELRTQLYYVGCERDQIHRRKAELQRRIADLENGKLALTKAELVASTLDVLPSIGNPHAATVWILNFRGLSQRAIARKLNISLGTVNSILGDFSARGLPVSRGRGGAGMHSIRKVGPRPKMTAQTMAQKKPDQLGDPRYTEGNLYGQVDGSSPAADTTPELNT